MIKTILAAVIVLFATTGCIQFNDYEMYTKALKAHSESESQRIQAQSTAILSSIPEDATDNERMLWGVIAMLQIGGLEPVQMGITKPTTGYDILRAGVDYIQFVASTYGMFRLGQEGIRAAGNVVLGDGVVLNDSLNRPTVSTVGYSNTTNYQGTAPAQVVEPMVIEGTK